MTLYQLNLAKKKKLFISSGVANSIICLSPQYESTEELIARRIDFECCASVILNEGHTNNNVWTISGPGIRLNFELKLRRIAQSHEEFPLQLICSLHQVRPRILPQHFPISTSSVSITNF
jgi:hypothetical protein